MKLWTDEDLKDVEILVEKLEKNLKSEPGPIKQLMIMIGQAFAEIKHYKSIIELYRIERKEMVELMVRKGVITTKDYINTFEESEGK